MEGDSGPTLAFPPSKDIPYAKEETSADMPGYKTHITASSLCGTILGGTAFFFGHIDPSTAIFGGSLCAIGGLVPDIDSKSSTSFKRCLSIVAGFSSLLLVSRLRDYPFDPQSVAIIGGGNFILTFFFLGKLIQKFTVHRGMCHSIPMAVLTGEIAFLLSSGGWNERLFCGTSAMIGVLVHLLLDEFYSVQVQGVKVKIKKSLGSALKLADFDNKVSTFFMFTFVGIATFAAVNEPVLNKDIVKEQAEKTKTEILTQSGGDELRQLQTLNPDIYDLSVVEWAIQNDLQFSPRSSENPKWNHLKILLSGIDEKPDEENLYEIDTLSNYPAETY